MDNTGKQSNEALADEHDTPGSPRSWWSVIASFVVAIVSALALLIAGPALGSPANGAGRSGKKTAKIAGNGAADRIKNRRAAFGRAGVRIIEPVTVRFKNGKIVIKSKKWFQRRKTKRSTIIHLE